MTRGRGFSVKLSSGDQGWVYIIIKMKSSLYHGNFSVSFMSWILSLCKEIQGINLGYEFIWIWRKWILRGTGFQRSWIVSISEIAMECCNYGGSDFIIEYFLDNRMAMWSHYKRMLGSLIFCISSSRFLSIIFKKDQSFLCIMSQSHLLSNNGEGTRKRLKILVPHFDNSELVKSFSKTLIGRCMNPEEHEMKALITNIPKIWKLEDRVVGTELGHGMFQFVFENEEDIDGVLKLQPFHFDYWMLSLARWQPKRSQHFPLEIPF